MVFGVENELLVGMSLGAGLVWYLWNKFDEDVPKTPRRLRKFTLEDLSLYTGKDRRLCYVAVEDQVFDVTKDRQKFAGKGGTSLDSAKLPEFEKYTKVGTLIRPRDFTPQELREFDGRDGKPVYVAAKGVVYDVDPEFYGPDGPYGIMAGRDATRALALVSLEQADIDNTSTDDLAWGDLNTLEEWIAKFEFKYNRVGYLIDAKKGSPAAKPGFLDKSRQQVKLQEKIIVSPDTRIFRFELPEKNMRLGLPTGKHVKIWCPNPRPVKEGEWNGRPDPETTKEEIERKYTPASIDAETEGYFDLVIKVYRGGEIDRFPDGGKMSQYLESLSIGDSIDIAGPYGLNEYLGKGVLKVRKKERNIKHIGMIAGGTGITPMLQVMKSILRDRNDPTKMSLIFANQEEKDILVRDMIEKLQEENPDRLKIHYTLDRPPTDWEYSSGFVTDEMIKAHLPPPTDDCVVLMCGPPPMIKFACKANLDKLGYSKDQQIEF
mmetsp:Transcript_15243/g.18490  ORF Transcript_15243/g.18490 Transcript_15243/m.18490 type:complete len:490 (-) Transcript_15243:3244-4713(-)